jgi:Transposase DNA-binding
MIAWSSTHQSPPADWAATHFGGCWLGHKSRNQRLVSYAGALAEKPGQPLPELFTRKYDIEATYTLLRRNDVTPDRIQAAHRRLVKAELGTPGRFLLIEDTTFPSYTHRHEPVPGLGPIGGSESGQQGFLLHSVLAVRAAATPAPDATGRRPPVTILGLADQQYLIRSPRPEAKSKQTVSRQRTERDRESDRWLESSRRIGPAPATSETRWVRVADRESDIYEYIIECKKRNHGFVIRVSQDRVLLDPATEERLGLVFDHVQAVEPVGGMYLDLRARPPHDGQPGCEARRARLLISCGPVRIQAPERPGHAAGTGAPIDCWFIRVWEPEPPAGVERLEWVLYTDARTEALEEALVGVMDYGSRFLIEEFHKGTKTGMKIEQLQMETGERLFRAIAVMSIVALRLLDIRELGRAAPAAPAALTGLSALELDVLSLAVDRTLTTVASVILALGRLGGHMNRPSDGMPGWITLWRGMQALRLMVKGAKMAEHLKIFTDIHYPNTS